MTEAEWNVCTDPLPMLEFVRGKASDRKLRLFAVHCVRSIIIQYLPDDREAVDLVEEFLENAVDAEAYEEARAWYRRREDNPNPPGEVTLYSVVPPSERAIVALFDSDCWESARAAAHAVVNKSQLRFLRDNAAAKKAQLDELAQVRREIQEAQVPILRELLGNPFHPVTIVPAWLAWNNATVPRLAEAIYTDRAFDRLPILADALEDAGCTDQDILAHCRGPGPHVRGCWVVDLLLGRS